MSERDLFTRRETIAAAFAATAWTLTFPLAKAAARDTQASSLLWYAKPADAWVEALPIGNGRLGAMVFGGIAQERLQLNEDTLWSGGPYAPASAKALDALPEARRLIFAGNYAAANELVRTRMMGDPLRQTAYLPLGDLYMDMYGFDPFARTAYRRALDLTSAVASTTFSVGGVNFTREYVASPDDQVIAIRLRADRPGSIGFNLMAASPQARSASRIDGGDTLILSGASNPENGLSGALSFEARIRVVATGGVLQDGGDHLRLRGADEAIVLIAMATSFRRYDDVGGDPAAITREQIARASRRGYDAIAAGTTARHAAIFRRVAIDLGTTAAADRPTDERIAASEKSEDPALAALYFDFARYLLICSSRPGTQPANLQGIWNDQIQPKWGSKYTININTQMNYWPAEPTAMPEMVEPLIAMVRDLAVTGARTARVMYGARGWVCHHNTDLWRGTAPIEAPKFGFWPTGGAWLCLHLWDRYDYGRDLAYLASVYPILRDACLFFLDTLVRDPRSGWMVTNPSMSPENLHGHGGTSLCAGPTMDMQILRDLFANTAQAAAILRRDAALRDQFVAMAARLAPTKVGAQGQIQEWQEDWDAGAPDIHHRHVSHLYGLYPSNQIDVERTPALAAAARRTLDIRGDKATGWATAWRINLWARLRDGDRAHAILRFLLGPERTYPNMFDAHPPFQIDGNFGGASGIVEMLMRSVGDEIVLLPALPQAWPTGSITGLRARGGCTVDLHWRAGEPTEVRMVAERGGRWTVRHGDARATVALRPRRPLVLRGAELRSG